MNPFVAFILVVAGVSGFCASNSFVNGVLPLGCLGWLYEYIPKSQWRMLVVAIPNVIISYMIASAFRFHTPTAFATCECAGVISLIVLSCLMKRIWPTWEIYAAGLLVVSGTLWLTLALLRLKA